MIKGWFSTIFKRDIEKAFEDVKVYRSEKMEAAFQLWKNMEAGTPPWKNEDVRTISFSNTLSRELAKLIFQEIDIKIEADHGDSAKAEAIQKAIDKSFLANAQADQEEVIRLGGVLAKWNGEGIEYLTPDRFLITDYSSDGSVNGVICYDYKSENKKYYTRAEWHRFETQTRRNEDGTSEKVKIYKISNKVFVSEDKDQIGRQTTIDRSPWKNLEEESQIENLEKPLYAYWKNPYSNTIDPESPLGVSLFAECKEEFRWLDIAMSNMGVEVEDGKPIMFVDEGALIYAQAQGIELPRFVKGLQMGVSVGGTVQQWQPQLQVQNRIEGINFYLNIISTKCGLDPGTFVFNGQAITMATATQVEASERKTVKTVLTYRNLLDRPESNGDGRVGFIHDIAYIIDVMMSAEATEKELGEFGNYKIYADFADITINPEEEKMFDFQLAQNGYMSKVRYLVRHRGMTENEAKEIVREANEEQAAMQIGGLFTEE